MDRINYSLILKNNFSTGKFIHENKKGREKFKSWQWLIFHYHDSDYDKRGRYQ